MWGTPGITPGRRQRMVKVLLLSGPAWCQRPGVDLGMDIPLRCLGPPLQMALSIFGNRREAPEPLADIKRPFWAIMPVFVDRNYACEGRTLSLRVAMPILLCVLLHSRAEPPNYKMLKAQIYKSFPTPPHWFQENATFQVGIGN